MPLSNVALSGLYFFDQEVCEKAKDLKPSARGELEITGLLNYYLIENKLKVITMGRGYTWLDTGTHESLLDAGICKNNTKATRSSYWQPR